MWKTQSFEEKGKLSSENKSWPIFPPVIEHDKDQATAFEGQKGLFTTNVNVISVFL